MRKDTSRRKFLKTTLAAVGTAGVSGCAFRQGGKSAGLPPVSSRTIGANDRIRVGLIGCGGMGRGDLLTFLKFNDVDCPLICDVDDAQIKKVGEAVEKVRGKQPESVKDFRRVIDRPDIDACIVATPDHWHALPTIYACQAGKDVYCEKPLATSIVEGRAMVAAARKYDRVVQVGTQWRSGEHYQQAVAYVQSGKLGKIRLVRCWPYLLWVYSVGRPADCDPPPGVDYDMWLGPAPKRPFNPKRFHFDFRWFWDYAGGLQTDWGVHLINIVHWAMQVEAPLRVSSTGGKYVWDDISETPDTQISIFEYAGFPMIWEHQCTGGHGPEGREHGVAFVGTEGTLIVDQRGWEVVPDGEKKLKAESGKSVAGDRDNHVRNFLDCMRSRKRPVSDIEIIHRATAVGHLANISYRIKRSVQWDAQKERIVGDAEASRMLAKPYRAPWKLPAV
ncbi:MAG: Gfo/Idh/MocA family oxidoreductase [Candidatus Sumerlaeia bacterium]|nr:Gfo/Idh/MocA family oxidoreductase [Candidatus Sumerlaeia bacterium]